MEAVAEPVKMQVVAAAKLRARLARDEHKDVI
jgi:hypothetical protein